jgi:hypothetical protein
MLVNFIFDDEILVSKYVQIMPNNLDHVIINQISYKIVEKTTDFIVEDNDSYIVVNFILEKI